MNQYSLLTLFLLFVHTSFAQFTSDRYHPKSILSKQRIDSCKIYSKTKTEAPKLSEVLLYSLSGDIIKIIDYEGEYSNTYRYDTTGRLVAKYFIPVGEGFYERDTLIYDTNNNLILDIAYKYDGSESTRYKYVYSKNILQKEFYFLNEKLKTVTEYVYDGKNRLIKETHIYNGQISELYSYKYDDSNNLIEFTTSSSTGTVNSKQFFKYNTNNLKIEQSIYDENNMLSQVYKTYYLENGLIDYEEWFTGIENNKINKSDYKKLIYTYTVKK
ncbi:MAG TPA: hypothetical protein VK796_07475 [Cytophaga sp.]|jgi:hypothetical protein|nr:hypothetical protein [Cytophaga sp.]